MVKEIFSRYEVKYLLPYELYEKLEKELHKKMKLDSYANEDGRYSIISLYFDSPDKKIYYETRNKARFRQKLRLRIYDTASLDDYAFFEVKKKYKKRTFKRRTNIRLRDAYRYLSGQETDMNKLDISNSQIFKEIEFFKNQYNLHPENVVSYERQAFVGIDDPDLRVTFDFNLKCRGDDLRIENGAYGTFFTDPNLVILEVKVNHSVPLWLSRVLSELGCEKKSVSKFCTSADVLSEEDDIGKDDGKQSIIV
ncbi:VTC domain-containing protein [Alteribacter lacisalsi]|uniref:VTC domain-containing protein n=1 Tax=Alteribacter lacisalsi TaxID=2045244 RepID=A0A2W0HG77_9BACI|nr:polyphosphate polymerase domain-containing protein [Alteribacter lacisalsi]PYZ95882.1 VTC domain-containing protein [Alteribacter lacisalsi]